MKRLPQFVAGCSLALAALSLSPAMPESWSLTGSLLEARRGHSATLLGDGRVLVAGGSKGAGRSAELFDPETQTWSLAAPLAVSRAGHTATLMADGRVLVAGGDTHTAEVYDPSTDSWTLTTGMAVARFSHSAIALRDGTVLVAGGFEPGRLGDVLAPCELYDPASGMWRATAPLNLARYEHRATLLNDGSVLVTGGSNDGDLGSTLSSTETYDPASGTWTLGPNTEYPGMFHTATVMPSGQVLVTGGYDWPPRSSSRTEVLDPRAGRWSVFANSARSRDSHTATALANGDILVTGGRAWVTDGRAWGYGRWLSSSVLDASELFSEESGRWREGGSLNVAREGHTATLLLDGRVLVAGGVEYAGEPLASAELYGKASPIERCKNHYILMPPCPEPN